MGCRILTFVVSIKYCLESVLTDIMKIEKFEMMRMQCLYKREVEFDLSETTVLPLRISELLDGVDDIERFNASRCLGGQE
jgi:hypothetical protein